MGATYGQKWVAGIDNFKLVLFLKVSKNPTENQKLVSKTLSCERHEEYFKALNKKNISLVIGISPELGNFSEVLKHLIGELEKCEKIE